MANVTMDRRGLSVGGERRWIVSGTIDPAMTAREEWGARLDAAAGAGLNCVLVPAVWSAHEPREGAFDFEGDRDLAEFIRMASERGLMVALRPGPFQGGGRDRGGIPAWVDPGKDDDGRALGLRSSSAAFLSACSSWLRALARELKGLQATEGGPIVLVQNEHRWFCADTQEGSAYLGELGRFLREAGFSVPVVSANNLHAAGEGETEGWNGHADLLATFRQLRAVRPGQACLAWDFELGRSGVWGDGGTAPDPERALHELAQAMAAGAQVNLGPFASGSRFGFDGGRLAFERDGFVTQAGERGAALDESGRGTDALDALRALLIFSSSFERVLAGVEWDAAGGVMAPQVGAETVVHGGGENGSVVFALRDPDAKTSRGMKRELLLPDGRTLEVDLKDRGAVWCVVDAPIGTSHRLEYSNASAVWRGSRALALTAPAGSEIVFSINGSEGRATPSRGKTATIVEHEGVMVAALSTEQASACCVVEDGLLIGAERAGVARDGWKKWTLLREGGEVERGEWEGETKKSSRRTLSGWSRASAEEFVSGQSQRFAVIDGPATLDELGASEGYGWLRWSMTTGAAKKVKALLPESNDRMHVRAKGELVEIAGLGPGASEEVFSLALAKGKQTLTALVDNLGRPSGGWSDAQKKGVWGPLQEVKAFKAGKATLEASEPLRPLAFRTPLTRLHADEVTRARRVTWSFMHRRKSALVFRLGALPEGLSGLLVVNDDVVAAFDEGSRGDIVLRQDAELRGGKNVVQFATLGDADEALKALSKSVSFLECVSEVTEKAEWAFARWETPADRLFAEWDGEDVSGAPCWWRGTFPAQSGDAALAFEAKGLTKGQLYLNGRNVGRYFNATRGGKAVSGQKGVYLPGGWLKEDAPNTLTVFDEHGASPEKCRVVLYEKVRG